MAFSSSKQNTQLKMSYIRSAVICTYWGLFSSLKTSGFWDVISLRCLAFFLMVAEMLQLLKSFCPHLSMFKSRENGQCGAGKLPFKMSLSFQEEKSFQKVSSRLLSSPRSEIGHMSSSDQKLDLLLETKASPTSAKQSSCSVNKERRNSDF